MRKLLNTLFVTSEDAYLTIDGENVVVNREKQEVARFPLHTLSGIISFSYAGASPALMGGCARRGVSLSFCTPTGRFLARSVGEENGNVLLRRMQYRAADDPAHSCRIACNMIFGKLHNARWSIERTKRDHALRVDIERLQASIDQIKALYPIVAEELSIEAGARLVRAELEKGLSKKDAVKLVAKQTGLPRNALYEAALQDEA